MVTAPTYIDLKNNQSVSIPMKKARKKPRSYNWLNVVVWIVGVPLATFLWLALMTYLIYIIF